MEEPDEHSGAVELLNLGDETETETEETEETTPVTPPSFDPEALAKSVGASVAEVLRQQKGAEAEKPITLEEAKKMLKIWEPDDSFITEFGNLETQKQAFTKLRDGLTQQFFAILEHYVKDRDSQIETRYNPVLQFMENYQAEQRESRFNKDYPQLAAPTLTPIRDAVITALLKDEGFRGKKESDQFKAIAAGVEAVIKQSNPAFKLNPVKTGQTKGNANGIPVTTPGAGGGGGQGRSETPKKGFALRHLG
jgi:hypothetical protein